MGNIDENDGWMFSREETLRLRINNLDSRARLILLAEMSGKKMFPTLSKSTNIPLETWRSWWKKGIVPNGTIVEAIARKWPQYAYWLVTGLTDSLCGHVMPPMRTEIGGYITAWPERGVGELENLKIKFSREYFDLCIEMNDDSNNKTEHLDEVKGKMLQFLKINRAEEIAHNFENCSLASDEFVKLVTKKKK
jgi:hypothetical protein